jgi:hypothetical protein
MSYIEFVYLSPCRFKCSQGVSTIWRHIQMEYLHEQQEWLPSKTVAQVTVVTYVLIQALSPSLLGNYCLVGCDVTDSARIVPTFQKVLMSASYTPATQAAGSPKMSVHFQQAAWRRISEDIQLYEKSKSQNPTSVFGVFKSMPLR